MKKMLSIVFMGLILITACSSSKTEIDEKHIDSEVIGSNEKVFTIHGINLGTDTDKVVERLGYPQKKDIGELDNGETAVRYVYGETEFGFISGNLSFIRSKDSEYETAAGISPGDSSENILVTYREYEPYSSETEIFVPIEDKLLIFLLRDIDYTVDSIAYTYLDAFNMTSDKSFEELKLDLVRNTDENTSDEENSDIDSDTNIIDGQSEETSQKIIEAVNFSFDMNNAQIIETGIGSNSTKNEIIEKLKLTDKDFKVEEQTDQTDIIKYANFIIEVDKETGIVNHIVISEDTMLNIETIYDLNGEPTTVEHSDTFTYHIYQADNCNIVFATPVQSMGIISTISINIYDR